MARAQSQPRVVRNGPSQEGDVSTAEVIKLYERLTNILILRTEPSKFQLYDLPQLRYHCVYTHTNENAENVDAAEVQCTWSKLRLLYR